MKPFELYIMNTQILNGTIDPNWVMAITLAVVGVLLVRILNRLEKKVDNHDEKLAEHSQKIAVIENEINKP
jgi:uncharacterized protein YoxC